MSTSSRFSKLRDCFVSFLTNNDRRVEHFIVNAMSSAGESVYDVRHLLFPTAANPPAWLDQIPTMLWYPGDANECVESETWETYWWRVVELAEAQFRNSFIQLPLERINELESNRDLFEIFNYNFGRGDNRLQREIWNQIVRASAACCEAIVLTLNERRTPDQSDDVEEASDDFTDVQREVLQAMLELGALNKNSRKTASEIAEKSRGSSDESSIKRDLSELARRMLAESKTGRGGGSWLTDRGAAVARDLPRHRKR